MPPVAAWRDSEGSRTTPSGTPITPIGIWRIANAKLKTLIDPVGSVDARLVMTRNTIWVAPRPSARGAISTSVRRACGSPMSIRGRIRAPIRRIVGTWTSRWPAAPTTTPRARPATPNTGTRNSAPPMIPRLYASGAIAAAPNRPRALSTLVATAPAARNRGARTMIRVSSVVRARLSASKPGVIVATSPGASSSTTAARIASVPSISVVTLDTTRHARASSSFASSPAMIGIIADDSAPAATSWNRKSGIRNAAKNASSC